MGLTASQARSIAPVHHKKRPFRVRVTDTNTFFWLFSLVEETYFAVAVNRNNVKRIIASRSSLITSSCTIINIW